VGRASNDLPERTWRFPRDRSGIDDAMRFAELALTYCDPACREAAVLAVAELAENVVKYGAHNHAAGAPTLAIGLQGKVVRIRVKNPVNSGTDARSVVDAVSRIASSPDVRDLYRTRLAQLFANPTLPRAQLGLLRIAFEGRFRLSCDYHDPFLELVAERTCDEVK
jgi:hypothetical protein